MKILSLLLVLTACGAGPETTNTTTAQSFCETASPKATCLAWYKALPSCESSLPEANCVGEDGEVIRGLR